MAGAPVTVLVMAGNPIGVGAGRIIIISADPNPASINPFIMSRNPDGIAIGALPAAIVNPVRWRRSAHMNIKRNCCCGVIAAHK